MTLKKGTSLYDIKFRDNALKKINSSVVKQNNIQNSVPASQKVRSVSIFIYKSDISHGKHWRQNGNIFKL